jgi:hypothetical protein
VLFGICLVVSGQPSSPSISITRLDSYPVSPEDASLFRYGRTIVWMLNSEQAFACFSHYTSRDACATSGHSFSVFSASERDPTLLKIARNFQ